MTVRGRVEQERRAPRCQGATIDKYRKMHRKTACGTRVKTKSNAKRQRTGRVVSDNDAGHQGLWRVAWDDGGDAEWLCPRTLCREGKAGEEREADADSSTTPTRLLAASTAPAPAALGSQSAAPTTGSSGQPASSAGFDPMQVDAAVDKGAPPSLPR